LANYVQWSASKKLARAIWVWGPEEALKLEVSEYIRDLVMASDLDKLSFDASSVDQRDIWEALYGKSLSDDASRLVEVSNASKIEDFSKLSEWLSLYSKYSAETTILFTSVEEPPIVLKLPKAISIKCVMPKPEDRVQWAMKIGGLSESSAKRLVKYKNGNLEGIRDVCLKIRRLLPDLQGIEISVDTLESLDEQTPAVLVESVLEKNKEEAFAAAARVPVDGISRVLSSLEYNIGLIEKLKPVIAAQPRGVKLEPVPGFPMARISDIAPLTRIYSEKELLRCRQLVVLMESYNRQGITEAVLESLISLW
jgi:hypothetical protein